MEVLQLISFYIVYGKTKLCLNRINCGNCPFAYKLIAFEVYVCPL